MLSKFLQRTLQNLLPKQQILAVIIASLIFGIAHFSRRTNIYII
ncbi:type II CAAX prenyl endopeptidase Rce1 family protein [Rickettsia montanensis]